MVFVTVGTQKFPFNRLLEKADMLAQSSAFNETVFVQTGHSDYIPKHCKHKAFLQKAAFDKIIQTSSCIVTHGGVGAIITALKYDKPVIVLPRLRRYGEHVDDHQCQIAQAFGKKKMILLCGEEESLEDVIEKSREFQFEKYISQQDRLIGAIDNYLEGIDACD